MKKVQIGLLIVMVASLALAEVPSVSVQSGLKSKYIAENGVELYDGTVIQSDVFASFKNGVYVDLWNSSPYRGFDQTFGTEVDLGVGWSGPLVFAPEVVALQGFRLNVGVAYYNEPGLNTLGAEDIIHAEVTVSKQFKWVGMFHGYKSNTALKNSSYEGTDLWFIGFNQYAHNIMSGLDLKTVVALYYSIGGTGNDDGLYVNAGTELDKSLNEKLTLVLPVRFVIPVTIDDARDNDIVVGAGLAYKF